MTRRTDWLLWTTGAILLGLTVYGASVVDHFDDWRVGYFLLGQAPFYALAAWIVVVRPPPTRGYALAVILVVGLAMRLLLLPGDPVSTDVFRYVWDGRVQGAGINPYLFVPADEALRGLRDDAIYPNINRVDYAPTIYPPMAQVTFFLITRISESVTFMKATMIGFEAVAVWAIVRLLAARGQPTTNVLLYVWHPLPLWEFARSGHVDAVAIACLMLALLAAHRRSPILAGMALGAGTLVKYSPLVTAPGLYRRWDWRLPAALAATFAIFYLPYLGAGTKVIGFLPGYVSEENLDRGTGFFVLHALDAVFQMPPSTVAYYLAASAAIMIILAFVVVMRKSQSSADLFGAMVLTGAFLFLLSPHYAWYFTWLVPFHCFYPSIALMYLTCVSGLLYLGAPSTQLFNEYVIYGGFVAALLAELSIRRQLGKRHNRGMPPRRDEQQ